MNKRLGEIEEAHDLCKSETTTNIKLITQELIHIKEQQGEIKKDMKEGQRAIEQKLDILIRNKNNGARKQ